MGKTLLSIFLLFLMVVPASTGCGSSPSTLTTLSATEGEVSAMKTSTDSWIEAEVGMSLRVGDTVRTGDDSSAEITFFDGSTLELEAGTEIEIVSLGISGDTGSITIILEQTIGSILFRVTKIVDPASRYEVETPAGVVAVRGSAVRVYVAQDGTTRATNLEGMVWAVGEGVELQIPEGQQCIIRPGEAPELITMIVAGYEHTIGLRSDGTVLAVGNNTYEQCNVGAWTDIVQVAAGLGHTVGVRSDGTVVAVGHNKYEQCEVGGWTDIIQVATGFEHTVGVKSDGTAVAVGWNGQGECDVGSWTGIIEAAAGSYHTVGLKSDGTVVAVGLDLWGQCDVGTWTDIIQVAAGMRHSIGLKANGTVVAVGDNLYGRCDVGDWANIVQVAGWGAHTVGLKSGGTVLAVGYNEYGQCNVGSWTDITQVGAGAFHTVGVTSSGAVLAVGYDLHGQCDVSDWNLNPPA
jgi:alpha-tubulin suppressor-like RCC1 family protein